MKTYDLTPLLRSAVGFDRLAAMLDEAASVDMNYPPYNIELIEENKYAITMAVAGFDRSELDIVSERGTLKISGRKKKDDIQRKYLHRGLAARDFEQRFQLADHVKVVGAKLDNGLLHVDLLREIPEEYKPRKIAIDGMSDNKVQQLEQREPQTA
jgi:molecular chaperone IbpA